MHKSHYLCQGGNYRNCRDLLNEKQVGKDGIRKIQVNLPDMPDVMERICRKKILQMEKIAEFQGIAAELISSFRS